jgi:hypothetical protein
MKSALGTHRDLAYALRQQSKRVGERSPSVRGSDWRQATVTTVNGDGTVDADGIPGIRRMDGYVQPVIGDVIVITQAGDGNWLTWGRTVPTTSDGWVSPTLTAPWINYPGGGNYQPARYKRLPDRTVVLEGLIASNGVSVSGTSNALTLPAGYRPTATLVFATMSTGGTARQLEIVETGVVRFAALPAGAVGYISISCRFQAA